MMKKSTIFSKIRYLNLFLISIYFFSCEKNIEKDISYNQNFNIINDIEFKINQDTLNELRKNQKFIELVELWSDDYHENTTDTAKNNIYSYRRNINIKRLEYLDRFNRERDGKPYDNYILFRYIIHEIELNEKERIKTKCSDDNKMNINIEDDVIIEACPTYYYNHVNNFISMVHSDIFSIQCWNCGINNTFLAIRDMYIEMLPYEIGEYCLPVSVIIQISNNMKEIPSFSSVSGGLGMGLVFSWSGLYRSFDSNVKNKLIDAIHRIMCGNYCNPDDYNGGGSGNNNENGENKPPEEKPKDCEHEKCDVCGGCKEKYCNYPNSCSCVCTIHPKCDYSYCKKCIKVNSTGESKCNECPNPMEHFVWNYILTKCNYANKIFTHVTAIIDTTQWYNVDRAVNTIKSTRSGGITTSDLSEMKLFYSVSGTASYENGGKVSIPQGLLNIGGSILESPLFHEFFHAFQNFSSITANMELEAKLAQIYFCRQAGIDNAYTYGANASFMTACADFLDNHLNNLVAPIPTTKSIDIFFELLYEINKTDGKYTVNGNISPVSKNFEKFNLIK